MILTFPGPVVASMTPGPGRGVDWPRLRAVILPFLWPRESLESAASASWSRSPLLVAAKLINIQVPFFLKAVVDRVSAPRPLLAMPLAALIAYGAARLGAAGFGELRDAVFAKVGQRAGAPGRCGLRAPVRALAAYHLQRRTGELAAAIERGVKSISFLLETAPVQHGPDAARVRAGDRHPALALSVRRSPRSPSSPSPPTPSSPSSTTNWRTRFRREMNERDNEFSGAGGRRPDQLRGGQGLRQRGLREPPARRRARRLRARRGPVASRRSPTSTPARPRSSRSASRR